MPDAAEQASATILVDDVRHFVDGRDCRTFRTSREAVVALRDLALSGGVIEHLWLDHDLGGTDTVLPVLDLLAELDSAGQRLDVRATHVITASATGGHAIMQALGSLGYPYQRHYSLRGLLSRHPAAGGRA